MSEIMSHIDDWTFDTFQLNEVTGGRPLSALSFFLIKDSGLADSLNLPEEKLSR